MKIKISELKKLMEKVVASKYYTSHEAEKIVEVLLYAELAGKNTQGLLKLLGSEPAQYIKSKYKPKIIRETALSALIDGGRSAGPLPAQMAAEKVIELATKNGFGIVGVNNTYSSVGALGFYARKIVQNNLISIVTANSPRVVVHFGGLDPAYGTNPIAFGFPTEDRPIIFDMATSAITWYGLVRAKALGEKLPNNNNMNVAIDKDGNITTNPEQAMQGAILPHDQSYKGSGMALVVELLAGVLTGAGYSFDEGDWGTTFIAFSPNLLMDVNKFKKCSSDLIKKVKQGRTDRTKKDTKGKGGIRIPGYDLETEIQKTIASGELEVEERLLNDLRSKL